MLCKCNVLLDIFHANKTFVKPNMNLSWASDRAHISLLSPPSLSPLILLLVPTPRIKITQNYDLSVHSSPTAAILCLLTCWELVPLNSSGLTLEETKLRLGCRGVMASILLHIQSHCSRRSLIQGALEKLK